MGATPGRFLWLLALVVTLGAGVVTGSRLGPRDAAMSEQETRDETVSRLEQEVRTLQAQLRARDARLVAAHEKLAVTTGPMASAQPPREAAPRPAEPVALAVATDARTASRPPARADAPDDRPASRTASRGTPQAPATVEGALQLFYRYLDENTASAGLERRWPMRDLLEELKTMGDAGAQALLRVLENGATSDERRTAAALLGALQDRRAVPILQHIVETENDVLLRRAAAQSLRRLQVAETAPFMEGLLANPAEDRFVRMSAALGLAQMARPIGVAGLTQIFAESTADGRGRDAAFRSLASLNDERPLPFMRQVIVSPIEPGYRLQAIRFVAAQGDRQALAMLQRVMDSPTEQPSIREAASNAFTAITKK